MSTRSRLRGVKRLTAFVLALSIPASGIALASSSVGKQPAGKRSSSKRGPRGPRGATGPRGPAGSLVLTYVGQQVPAASHDQTLGQAQCPDGENPIGGGVSSSPGAPLGRMYINTSIGFPRNDQGRPSTWIGLVDTTTADQTFTVTAICTPSTVGQAPAKASASPDSKRGRRGPRGATGPQGPPGPSTPSLDYVSKDFTAFAGQRTTRAADCPAGEKVTGGGVQSSGPYRTQWVNSSFPDPSGFDAWIASVDTFDVDRALTVYAICTPARVAKRGSLESSHAPAKHSNSKRGPRGPRGATGPQGPAGSLASIPLSYVVTDPTAASPGAQTRQQIDCPGGESVTGGGTGSFGSFGSQVINTTRPLVSGGGWVSDMDTIGSDPVAFQIEAICTPASVVEP